MAIVGLILPSLYKQPVLKQNERELETKGTYGSLGILSIYKK